MLILDKGAYVARQAATAEDVAKAQELRWLAFRSPRGAAGPGGRDQDAFDDICRHVLIQEVRTGRTVGTFRLLLLGSGAEIGRSYSAQYYDLSGLAGFRGAMAEMGRFCLAPGRRDPDILRVAWGAVTRFVEDAGAEMLFGCASFDGTDAAAYADAFALLKNRHLAPPQWRPQVKAPEVFCFRAGLRYPVSDLSRAIRTMPPVLRTYLSMGGWVSDHAVIDRDLGTMHVFTGLEVARIPESRVRTLRGVAEFCA